MTYQVNNDKSVEMSITLFDNVKESITCSNKSYKTQSGLYDIILVKCQLHYDNMKESNISNFILLTHHILNRANKL